MTKEKEKKSAKEQLLLEASRLGDLKQLELILGQFQQHKLKRKTNPLASLRKTVGPNSIRDPVTGFTCLHHAALNGHAECVKLILSHGAQMNSVDYKGSSALHLAAWAGNLNVVRTLLNFRTASRSPSSSSSSSSASPAKESASSRLSKDKENWLPDGQQRQQQQQHGGGKHEKHPQESANIDLCNNDNQTPLSLASQFGHDGVVSELLKHSANVHLRNNHFESPLDLACLNGRLQTVELLLNSTPSLVADLRKSRSSILLRAEVYRQNSRLNHESCPPSSLTSDNANLVASPVSATATLSRMSNNVSSTSGSGGHSRRASGSGWSSLLRGSRRESSSSTAVSVANQSSSPSSPPTTTTTGSKRQAPLATSGQLMQLRQFQSCDSQAASLSPLLMQHQVGVAGWPAVSAATGADNLVDRLLDHSPLHYAVRRGHSDVVQLLLKTYGANILQITSLGSVLHEIALNNGKHSDVMRQLFRHISDQVQLEQAQSDSGSSADQDQKCQQKRLDQLEKFLNLSNAQNKTVFEVLNEINNRSAQEIKRLIYDFSEQIQNQFNAATTSAARGGMSASSSLLASQQHNHSNTSQQKQRQSNNNLADLGVTNLMVENRLQQQSQQQVARYQHQIQASDLRQIETFATMKRVPKQQRSAIAEKTNELNQMNNMMLTRQQQQVNQHQPPSNPLLPFNGTQTIDRRRTSASKRQQQQQQQFVVDFAPNIGGHNYDPNHSTFSKAKAAAATSGSQQQLSYNNNINHQAAMMNQLSLQQLQQNSPMMTRSVSNLSSVLRPTQQQHILNPRGENDDYNAIMWHQWLASGAGHQLPPGSDFMKSGNGHQIPHQDLRHPVDSFVEMRKRRSRSRDSGSILKESAEFTPDPTSNGVGHLHQQQQQSHRVNADASLRTNNISENSASQMATNMVGQLQQQQHQMSWAAVANGDLLDGSSAVSAGASAAAHLVRSQTDCSHLMGRFFGDQSSLTEQNRLMLMSAGLQQKHQHQPVALHHQVGGAPLQAQAQAQVVGNLDRKTINRHYHVYEHEFYPPRILPQQHQHQQVAGAQYHRSVGSSSVSYPIGIEQQQRQQVASGKQSAAIAIVPPFGLHGDQRSSARSGGNFMVQSDNATSSSIDNNLQQSQMSTKGTDSRLSLNLDLATQQQMFYHSQQQHQHQGGSQSRHQDPYQFESTQQQMDRFLGRHSRKAAIPQTASFDLDQLQNCDGNLSSSSGDYPNDSSGCQSVADQQKRRDLIELQRKLMAKQQLDFLPNSQSLESHLSEPYLFESTRRALMQDFDRMIGQELLNRDHRSIIGNTKQMPTKPTKLTGVSLDMDKYGDSLTVTGVRVTIPDDYSHDQRGKVSSSSRHSLGGQRRLSQGSKTSRDSDELKVNIGEAPQSVSNGTQTMNSPSVSSVNSSNSSNSSLASKARQQRQGKESVIYDLPSTASIGQTNTSGQCQIGSGQSSTGGPNKSVRVPSRISITEPPRERPPPPPALTTPLQVVAINHLAGGGGSTNDSCSSNSNNSNVSSGGSTQISIGNTHHHDSKIRANSTSGESGGLLLKMASNDSTTSSSGSHASSSFRRFPPVTSNTNMAPLLLNNDPDSGICTSNSPASTSHDSEDLLEINNQRQATFLTTHSKPEPSPRGLIGKTKLGLAIEPHQQTTVNHPPPPPSPHTAQQCIEDALMPLDRPFELINQATSPLSVASPSGIGLVDRWLAHDDDDDQNATTVATTTYTPATTTCIKPEADYENCISLQEQLRKDELIRAQMDKAVRGSLHETNSDDDNHNEDDDGDYADSLSSASMCNIANDRIREMTETSSPLLPDEPVNTHEYGHRPSSPIEIKGKELKLQVVISDENDQTVDGEQVFYINPSELRKITTDRHKTQVDAGSLTDEDLCATIDKDSGYIRFTLRKRKNNGSNEDASSMIGHGPSSMIDSGSAQESNQASTVAKKSRLNSFVASDMTEFTFKPNKVESMKVRDWFASNLVALCDYADTLIASGFDSLKFFNDTHLINDETLEAIGILDESHRMLIIDRVRSQLPKSNLDDLLQPLDSDSKRISQELFEVLLMDCLKSTGNIVDFESLKSNLVKKLPLGYSLRLKLALESIDKLINSQQPEPEAVDQQQQLSKQVSTDSSELEMDTSKASGTSSSSKESVRSIVMLPIAQRAPPQQSIEKQSVQREQPTEVERLSPITPTEKLINDIGKAPKAEPEPDIEDTQQTEREKPEPTDKVARNTTIEKRSVALVTRSSSGCGSLVSEVARRLEAAAQTNGPKLKPVAAARKFSGTPSSTTATTNKVTASEPVKPLPAIKPVGLKPEVNKESLKVSPIRESENRKMSPIKPAMSVRQTAAMFAPVKTTGWQRENIEPSDKPEVSLDNNKSGKLFVSKVTQDQAKAMEIKQQQQGSTITRPFKPPPPVKPAKLALASRVQ